jgi:tyrosine-protein kinase Etk/Wzc
MLRETIDDIDISSKAGLNAAIPQAASNEADIDPIEIATVLLREKKKILQIMLVVVLFTAVVVYGLVKPWFTAQATFLPPQNAPGSRLSQLASQLGPLGAVGALGGLKSPGDAYIGILGSRTIADAMVEKFDLQKVYNAKKLSTAEKMLKANSTFLSGKDTLITIAVKDNDPKRAADLANGYLDFLREQNGKLALSESSQRRLFFEQQLELEKNKLADAEVELRRAEEKTGIIAPYSQAQVEIEADAETRAQIASREVELASLRQVATDQNPAVARLQSEIAGLQQHLKQLQNDQKRQSGSVQLPTAKVPELALEYVRKEREVKYHEVLFQLLARQFETARLDESREAPLLQVVDRAVVPDTKSGPPRTLLLLAAAILGIFLGSIWVLFRNAIGTMQQNPAKARQLDDLRQAALGKH